MNHSVCKIMLHIVALWLAGIVSATCCAQSSGMPVEIIHADRMDLQKVGDSTNLTILEGSVVMKQGKTTFKCNRCVKNDRANTFEAWGNVHINDADTTNIYANHLRYLTDKQIAYLDGKVKLTDGKVVLTTPSAEYNMTTNIATYKNGGKVVSEKTIITSKAANYFTDLKDAVFMKDVKVNDPAYNIVSDTLWYNTEKKIASFNTYTIIRDTANRKITTKQGFYNLGTGDAQFGQRTMINDDNKSTVIADSLTLTKEFAKAKGQAVIADSVRKTVIIADLIYQDRLTEAVLATQKPLMIIKQENDSIYVTADTLFSAKLTDLYDHIDMPSKADSIWEHKTDSLLRTSDSLQSPSTILPQSSYPTSLKQETTKQVASAGTASLPANAPPQHKQPTDTIAPPQPTAKPPAGTIQAKNNPTAALPPPRNVNRMNADTSRVPNDAATVKNTKLKGKALADNDSTNRYFEAFHNVRIFSDSMQAVSDSLFYSFRDSTFRLYKDPVVWAKESQITGDTLLMHTRNRQPHWFEAIGNGFMVNHLEYEAFNQIKSTRIDGYFTNGALDSVRAKGSAEAVYFLQDDDSAYTGINQSASDIIDAYLVEKQLHKVVLRGQPKGTIYPIRQKSPKDMQLQGFRWREAERPKTKYDLLQ